MNTKKTKIEVTYLLGKNKQEITIPILVPNNVDGISTSVFNLTRKLEEKYGTENVELKQINNF
jgi:hypothetical protein